MSSPTEVRRIEHNEALVVYGLGPLGPDETRDLLDYLARRYPASQFVTAPAGMIRFKTTVET